MEKNRIEILIYLIAPFLIVYFYSFYKKNEYKIASNKNTVNLKYSGLKLQKEGLEEMKRNGTINGGSKQDKDDRLSQAEKNSHNSIAFTDDQSVSRYLSTKIFYSPDKRTWVQVNNMISINGQPAYFNLSFSMLSSSMGIVKGESMNNPDGVITIYVYPQQGCIESAGDKYCLNE